jgi:hypothetical protein
MLNEISQIEKDEKPHVLSHTQNLNLKKQDVSVKWEDSSRRRGNERRG